MQGLRLGGHPLHPALVHFPVVCWTVIPVLDLGYLLTQAPAWWQASFWCGVVGAAMGLVAMCAGFMDLMAMAEEHPGQAVAERHMMLMGSAWCLAVVALILQRPDRIPDAMQAWGSFSLSAAGFLSLGLGAYQGARLVYDFGVGHNRDPSPS
ncbi:MAG TPA: DUF2231 domain-containing protein [Gammaproteobacteria bacterium]|jgi:uncharacterized membrane protein